MSKLEKQIERLKSKPKDYTYDEANRLLNNLGFYENNKGKTSGSRVMFYREYDQQIIMLHKPHPGNEMKPGAVKGLLEKLIEIGDL